MARRIVILEKKITAGGDDSYRYALWIPVLAGRAVPRPDFKSSLRNATSQEIVDLRSGGTIEEIYESVYSAGTVFTSVQSDLQTRWTNRKAEIDALPNVNLNYGTNWDGTGWTAGTAAPSAVGKYQSAVIDFASTGDNTIVAGVTGQRIFVMRLFLVLNGTTTIRFKDGTTSLTGPLDVKSVALEDDGEPWFETSSGANLVINQTGTSQISGRVYYTQS